MKKSFFVIFFIFSFSIAFPCMADQEVTYHPNGKIKFEVPLVNGKRHGIAKRYSDNGRLAYTIEYRNGLKEGNSVFYADRGKTEMTFKNDKLVKSVNYWCDSNKIYRTTDMENHKSTNYYKSGEKQYTMEAGGKQEYFTEKGEKFAFVDKEGLFCKQKDGKYKKTIIKK